MSNQTTKLPILLLVLLAGCTSWQPAQNTMVPAWRYSSVSQATSGPLASTTPTSTDPASTDPDSSAVVRGQTPYGGTDSFNNAPVPGNGNHFRYPLQPSGNTIRPAQYPGTAPTTPIAPPAGTAYPQAGSPAPYGNPSTFTTQGPATSGFAPQGGGVVPNPTANPNGFGGPPAGQPIFPNQNPNTLPPPTGPVGGPGVTTLQGEQVFTPNYPAPGVPTVADDLEQLPPAVDLDVFVEETRTGRFMFGMGVNSDLGVTGQIVVDERNFDWRRFPTSFDDIVNGTAWRGAGQGFRLEAMPGTQVQRYLVSFTEPYFYLPGFSDPFSLNLSGFFFDRRYADWDEQRLGGRVALGYRVTHDLSLTTGLRLENVNIHDPRVTFVDELNDVLGDNGLYSGQISLTHDTRDTPFAATEGHLIELSYEQVFGTYDYPRGQIDYRQYFLVRERPDGSGRHSLQFGFKTGFSGSQTPIFENFFAGGFSTMRGFDFRGASPTVGGVTVGGEFQFLGTVEYMFPLTADDMVRGVVFCDYGTVERDIELNAENYRVAPGFGVRISIPALGPAPLALDFAFPVAHADTDDIQNFSFFFGFGR